MCLIITLQLCTVEFLSPSSFSSFFPLAAFYFDIFFLRLASSALYVFPFATSMQLYCWFYFFSGRERSNIKSITCFSAKNKPTSVDVFHSSPQFYSQVQYTDHLVFYTWKCGLLRTKKVYPHLVRQQLKIQALESD